MRPGFGRFAARNGLIKQHNYRGEAIFLAARNWRESRATTHAARLRLDKAEREARDAEMAELQALVSMGIGQRSYSNFMASGPGRPAYSPVKPGGAREALEKHMAAEAADSPHTPVRKHKTNAKPRTEMPSPAAMPSPAHTRAGDARSAWLAKQQSSTAAADPVIATIENRKPRKSAKAATTRD